MKIPLPTARKKARIEIIPLIDIVFFLLATFVMVSLSMVKNQGIAVKLPAAATSSAQDRTSFATVTVTESGEIFLDKERVDIQTLSQKLRTLKNQNPDIRVFVNGDEKAPFGDAIRALDEVRAIGIEKVSIQTKQRSAS